MASLVSFYADEAHKKPDAATDIHIEQLPVSEAQGFELGYPEVGVAYVRHPMRASRLISLASYHPTIVSEKVNDAIAMLTALGAAEIVLAYSNSNEVSNEVRADLELMFGLIKFGGNGANADEEKINVLYTARGTGAAPRPLPPLTWLDEPGWRGIIDGRLNVGLREFALSFTFDHKSGVDADLFAAVRKFGLRAGGEFRKAHRVSLNLRGTFPSEKESSVAQPVSFVPGAPLEACLA